MTVQYIHLKVQNRHTLNSKNLNFTTDNEQFSFYLVLVIEALVKNPHHYPSCTKSNPTYLLTITNTNNMTTLLLSSTGILTIGAGVGFYSLIQNARENYSREIDNNEEE